MNKRLGLIVGIGVLVGLLAVIALGTVAFAQGPAARGQRGWGSGGSMMGGHGGYSMGPGSGMMGGFGNVGPNCPGGGGWPGTGTPISMDEAADQVEEYLATWNNPDLVLAEVMEFEENFYAEVMEESTGVHAFELLVNRYTGAVSPEPGPNMMWNTEYGHMAGRGGGGMMGGRWGTPPSGEMTVTAGEAIEFAQNWLGANMPGVTAGEPETFYGYHTLHTLRNGAIEGMLSVNGYTGQVWYHNWHGDFIGMQEFHHDDHS